MDRNWLEKIRKSSGVAVTEICKKVGITATYYRYLEIGKRRPSPQVAQKLASLLNFDWTLFYKD